MEIGLALRSDRWVGADYWEQAADKTLTLEELLRRCEVVVMVSTAVALMICLASLRLVAKRKRGSGCCGPRPGHMRRYWSGASAKSQCCAISRKPVNS
jgi:hypothetical protein